MRGEVFDDTDISNPPRERPLTAGGNLIDLTQQTIFDALTRGLQCRVVALNVADAPDEALRLERSRRMESPRGRGDRLFNQRVDASFGQPSTHIEVECCGSCYDGVVEATLKQRIKIVEHRTVVDSDLGHSRRDQKRRRTRRLRDSTAPWRDFCPSRRGRGGQPLTPSRARLRDRVHGLNDRAEFVLGERGVHRQRQHL